MAALALRLAIIALTEVFDRRSQSSSPAYTDVDYYVFTDAAQLLLTGRSPYDRATYRYPPILAMIATINHLVHPAATKVVFSVVDVVAGLVMDAIIRQDRGPVAASSSSATSATQTATQAVSLGWYFNPIVINISTRGSADSLPCALTLLAMLGGLAGRRGGGKDTENGHGQQRFWRWLAVGYGAIAHGAAIHLKLYPIIYLPAIVAFFRRPRYVRV